MVDFDSLMDKEAFRNLEPARREALRATIQKLEGKSSAQAFGILMESAKNMPPGRKLSKEEQGAMLEAMVGALPESDRIKFKGIIKMMEKMNG